MTKSIREFRDHGLTTIRYGDVLVDLMRPLLPVYTHVLDGAIQAQVLGQTVRISSAEGLVIMKVVSMRPQDESDVQELLAAYGGKLDLDHVRAELETVAGPDDPRRAKFEEWVRQAIRRD